MGTSVSIREVLIRAGSRVLVQHMSVEVGLGETHAFIGPSGAGKTTLLRAVAGLVRLSEGAIALGTTVVATADSEVPAEERRVGFVFQGHGLWPHFNVREHLAFVLKCAGVTATEANSRINTVLGEVGLTALALRKPDTLSGGERQRLAIARAVATEPALLILDEPTASLDPITADEIRDCIRLLTRRTGSTVLLVTHDQREAFAMAKAVSIMSAGRLLQTGTPEVLWNHPDSAAVAQFLGEATLLKGRLLDGRRVETCLGVLSLSDVPRGDDVDVVIRPDDLVLGDPNGVVADVTSSWFREGKYRLGLKVGASAFFANSATSAKIGEQVRVGVKGSCPAVSRSSPL